ncbi:hypothetical protein SGPA1_60292 [Streptomyces misionensis JCM 4497]
MRSWRPATWTHGRWSVRSGSVARPDRARAGTGPREFAGGDRGGGLGHRPRPFRRGVRHGRHGGAGRGPGARLGGGRGRRLPLAVAVRPGQVPEGGRRTAAQAGPGRLGRGQAGAEAVQRRRVPGGRLVRRSDRELGGRRGGQRADLRRRGRDRLVCVPGGVRRLQERLPDRGVAGLRGDRPGSALGDEAVLREGRSHLQPVR